MEDIKRNMMVLFPTISIEVFHPIENALKCIKCQGHTILKKVIVYLLFISVLVNTASIFILLNSFCILHFKKCKMELKHEKKDLLRLLRRCYEQSNMF